MQDQDVFTFAARLSESGQPFAVATVIRAEGSTLAKPGFKVILSKDGRLLFGSLGGACPEGAIAGPAAECLKDGKAKIVRVHLEEAEKSIKEMHLNTNPDEIFVETFCGGTMELFIEPFLPKKRIVVIKQAGKDDVADSIMQIAGTVGLTSEILDLSAITFNEKGSAIDPLANFQFTPNDYAVILTKGSDDVKVLMHLAQHKLPYIGLMASRKRSTHDFKELKGSVDDAFIESIHTPIGVDIGAIQPQEIALSIIAEIIKEIRNISKAKHQN
jgi:xanthine dehydrogenase accessory factor